MKNLLILFIGCILFTSCSKEEDGGVNGCLNNSTGNWGDAIELLNKRVWDFDRFDRQCSVTDDYFLNITTEIVECVPYIITTTTNGEFRSKLRPTRFYIGDNHFDYYVSDGELVVWYSDDDVFNCKPKFVFN